MKQKVLFALIALMSFMTSWADDVVTVGGYKVTIDTKLVAIPVGPATATAPSVTKVTKGTETTDLLSSVADKVYKIEAGKLQEATLNEAGNYFLQVTLTDKASLLVPFRAGLTGDDYFDTETIWNKETFDKSVGEEDGILNKYYRVVWPYAEGRADYDPNTHLPSWSAIAQDEEWRALMFPQINYRVKGLDNETYAVYATYSAINGEETVTKGTYTENKNGYPALYGNGNFWMLSIPQLYKDRYPLASTGDNVDDLEIGKGYVLGYKEYQKTVLNEQTGQDEVYSWWDTASKDDEELDFENATIEDALKANFNWDNVQLFLVPQDDPYKLTVSLSEYSKLLDEGEYAVDAPEFTVSFGEEELNDNVYDAKWYDAEGNEVTLDGETNTYEFVAGTYTLVVTYEAEGDNAPTYTAVAQYVVVPYTYTYNDWTMTPVKATYIGVAFDPTITVDATDSKGEPVEIDANNADDVIVKYYTDAELTEEVDEMKHAGTYYVQVYVPGEAEEEAEQQGDDNQQGDNQQGDNQQGDNQQGDNQQGDNVEPAPAADEDPLAGYVALGEAKTFTINKNTLQVVLQQIYMPYGSSLADLKPDYALQKTSLDMTPEEDIAVENLGNIIKGSGWAQGEEETLDPDQVRNYTTSSKPKAYVGRTYDEEGNVVAEGYEDYIVTTNTSSANIVAIKGTLTVNIDADDLTKVYGFADPEYTFTAKNQAGEDVEGVEITRADKGTVEGEAVGFHDLTVTFDATHYDLVTTVGGEEADAKLEITPFDISQDNNTENGYGKDDPAYTEKFIIVKADSIYNGYAQYLDPVIKFNHAELGLVTLSNFVDYPVVGKGETYTTNDYTYTKAGLSSGGNYGGSYRWVKRDADGKVLDGATIRVDAVEGEGKNFTGSKTQAWAIQPAPLAVKVKDYTGENAKAYLSEATFEMETVGESDVVGYDQATSEPDHDKAALLAGLAAAIAAENGFEGYEKGNAASETPYTITVKAEAQTAVPVILSMRNYALDFTNSNGSLEIKKIELALKAADQRISYPVPTNETYTRPEAETEVNERTVTITGTLPEGTTLADLVTLKQTTTKVGNNEGALVLEKKEGVDESIEFTVAPGNLVITGLNEIHLSYKDMANALEDHKGQTVDVYLSNRKIKEDQWYAMVLPFEFNVPEFSRNLYYGVVDLLDTENASDDVRFKLTVGTVPANTPFLFKLAKDPAKAATAPAQTNDEMAAVVFENVTIAAGDDFAYDDAEKAPFSADAAGHKFVGVYPTLEVDVKGNKFGKLGMEANEWFISSANGGFYSGAGNANQKMLQTDAFISFPTAEAGAKARFFIEDADGTVTAIEGIDAEVPAEGNADAAREGWYTVNGVKLNAQPTQKGLYIFNGKKVYVK